jgi:hypothetical protein
MTVKTQGGKVITKGGKVSCSCCEQPGECCMYPAQALADGIYTYQDLPDSIEYLGTNLPVVLNKLDPPEFSNRFDGIAYFRGTYEFSGDTATVDLGLSEDIWVVGDSINDQARTNARCLIDSTRTLDQFADTYTVTYGSIQFVNSGSLQRTSLCVWDTGPCEWLGSFTQGWSAEMIYGDQTESVEEYRYKFRIILSEPDPEGNCNGAGVFVKTGDQNSPAGTYSDGLATITVS